MSIEVKENKDTCVLCMNKIQDKDYQGYKLRDV